MPKDNPHVTKIWGGGLSPKNCPLDCLPHLVWGLWEFFCLDIAKDVVAKFPLTAKELEF